MEETQLLLDIEHSPNMNLDIEAFALGAHDYLKEKRGSTSILEAMANENILPSFQGQRNWKYVQTPESLRLSDGDRVYSFGMGQLGDETARVAKLDDIPILDFENERVGGGTAQVHRASPDSIYLTLADGRKNPTFRLEHEEGKNWKYIPSKKMIARLQQLRSHGDQKGPEHVSTPKVNLEALMQGGTDQVKTAGVGEFLFGKGLSSVADPAARGLATDMALYSNPFTGVATGLHDTGKHLMNGRFLSALGSAGMGALSFIPGAGSVARGALSLGGKGLGALTRLGTKGVSRMGQTGKTISNLAETAGNRVGQIAQSPTALNIQDKANNFALGGRDKVNAAAQGITSKMQQVIPQKYNQWEHGFQSPIAAGGLRSPLSRDFNLGRNLRSGADMAIKNPLGTSQFFHNYGVGGSPEEALYKRSNFDGFFSGPSEAARFINGGVDGLKNLISGGLRRAGENPGLTTAVAVGGGIGLNKLREAVSEKHRENMDETPGKRFNREIALPALGGLTLAALGNKLT